MAKSRYETKYLQRRVSQTHLTDECDRLLLSFGNPSSDVAFSTRKLAIGAEKWTKKQINVKKNAKYFAELNFLPTFAHPIEKLDAQMAESVDALVSNTSRFTPVPVRPRLWVQRRRKEVSSVFFLCFIRLSKQTNT